MSLHVKVSGAWKEVAAGGGLSVKVSSAWKTVSDGYVRVSGQWKRFYQNAVYSLPASASDEAVSGDATAGVTFGSNGVYQAGGTTSGTSSGNWVTPTSLAPGGYTIRASVTSGTPPSGPSFDTDHALNTARSWLLVQSGQGIKSCELLFTLKDGDGNTVQTGACVMSATVLT